MKIINKLLYFLDALSELRCIDLCRFSIQTKPNVRRILFVKFMNPLRTPKGGLSASAI